MSTKVLLDTDLGSDVDDALALGVLLGAPEALDPVAVTTVAGDTRARAFAVARLLGLAGRTDVEVCAGARGPLVRRDRFVWREIETEGYPDGPDAVRSDEPAAERIVRAAREVPALELLAIGPMTNLAHALALDPELPRRVAGLTVMGGHVRRVAIGELECRPGIDYNLCSDPEASMCVLGAGFRTRYVTADVTLQTWMTETQRERLAAAPGPLAPLLAELVRLWTPWQRRIFTGIGGTLAPDNAAFLHDPLTVLALVDPAPLRFETLHILPTIRDGVLRTLEVPASSGLGAPAQVATAVDAPAAAGAIVDRLARV
ncbi:MAG: nucleoside hydrolase [Myxococcota bacterium]|nr:nucleoside hydrolase [Myxococcota bacterium]